MHEQPGAGEAKEKELDIMQHVEDEDHEEEEKDNNVVK